MPATGTGPRTEVSAAGSSSASATGAADGLPAHVGDDQDRALLDLRVAPGRRVVGDELHDVRPGQEANGDLEVALGVGDRRVGFSGRLLTLTLAFGSVTPRTVIDSSVWPLTLPGGSVMRSSGVRAKFTNSKPR